MRCIGTHVMGIRMPVITQGDDLPEVVVSNVLRASKEEGFKINDGDIIGITESIVARAQGNYATIDQITADVREKFPEGEVGVVFPIFSRNRFSLQLKGIACAVKKLYLILSYPGDEVGNRLLSLDEIDRKNVNPYEEDMDENRFRELFGENLRHEFTGIDYVEFYKNLSDNISVYFSNDPRSVLQFTQYVIAADIHSRERTKRILKKAGAKRVFGIDDILRESVEGSGFNAEYGLLGSNLASDDRIKLFPRDCDVFVRDVQRKLKETAGKNVEVLVYGDGAYKDPDGGIWELADPVVSPAYTEGLGGAPNEMKLKYLADNEFMGIKGDELERAVKKSISGKESDLFGKSSSQGTTPRRIHNLIGSLCDLTSGSGDKGTPVVLVQGYFDDYSRD